jgi:hypothetical protein
MIPDARCQIPDTRFQMEDQILGINGGVVIPDTGYRLVVSAALSNLIHDTGYQMPDTRY